MDNAQIIWNYLKNKGLTDAGCAGCLGNLYAESALNPCNLQNNFEKKLGMNDTQYTDAVDNGTYTNFVHDKAGFGLAQWTYHSRKSKLYDFCKQKGKSIGDLQAQLDFLYSELIAGYSSLLNLLKTTDSVKEASNGMLLQFERPADQSLRVQNTRASYSQKYYDQFHQEREVKTLIPINQSIKCNPGNYTKSAKRDIKYIVIHYTGNKKDSAISNAKYFANNANCGASAHYFVDDKEIYQSVQDNDKAWHCGTKNTYYHPDCRNTNSIGIEMCCTAGDYRVSEKTKQNAAELCANLCKKYNVTIDRVVRHYDVTHKNCPAQMTGANNAEWARFKQQVQQILNGEEDDEMLSYEQFRNYMNQYMEELANSPITWEQEAMNDMVARGLFKGDDKGRLMSKKFVTRGELATVLQRVLEK